MSKVVVQWEEMLRWSPIAPEHLLPALAQTMMRPDCPVVSRECIHAQLRYVACGEQSFVVGPKLRQAFERTDLKGIKSTDLKMPYQTFWVALPGCDWPIVAGQGDVHPTLGFYVTFGRQELVFRNQPDLPEQDVIRIVMWGKRPETAFGDDGLQTAHLALDECDRIGIEEYIEVTLADPTWESHAGTRSAPKQALDDYIRPGVVKAARVAINLLLFLNSPAAEAEETEESLENKAKKAQLLKQAAARKGGKAKKAKARAERVPSTTVVWVGKSVEKTSPRDSEGTSPSRHWVRGHWRRYHVGAGRKTQVLKWIQPFLRGGSAGDHVPPRRYTPKGGSPGNRG